MRADVLVGCDLDGALRAMPFQLGFVMRPQCRFIHITYPQTQIDTNKIGTGSCVTQLEARGFTCLHQQRRTAHQFAVAMHLRFDATDRFAVGCSLGHRAHQFERARVAIVDAHGERFPVLAQHDYVPCFSTINSDRDIRLVIASFRAHVDLGAVLTLTRWQRCPRGCAHRKCHHTH